MTACESSQELSPGAYALEKHDAFDLVEAPVVLGMAAAESPCAGGK